MMSAKINVRNLIIPKSKLGRLSLLAILGFIVFFILSQNIVISQGPKERPSFFNDPIPAALLIIAGLSGVSAFFLGIMAVIKSKDRAIPVFVAMLIGLFILFFWLGEIFSPH